MNRTLVRGLELYGRAQRVLPGGVSSNVKMEERPQPLYFVRAEGSHLYDVDGNEYIDYTCGYGPIVLGHAFPPVVEAVQRAAAAGFIFGGQHEGEVVLAERLAEIVPGIEMVRYNCTGSEAVAAACRIARGATGRTRIVRFAGHYHGWLDEQLIATRPVPEAETATVPESRGQPPSAAEHLLVAPWNDLPALEALFQAHGGEIAAVLMEPLMCNAGVIYPQEGYLQGVRALCHAAGALLIFDEIITGFRVHLGGAQALLGVVPDLTVLGKAMANGFPLSAVGGRREVMEVVASGGVVHAGTFNGNPLGVAAALATIQELARGEGAVYARMTDLATRLMDGIRAVSKRKEIPVLLQGPGPVFYLWFTDMPAIRSYRESAAVSRAPYERFAAALLAHGVRVIPGGRWYVSASHRLEDVERTLEAVDRSLDAVR
ncbi:MAG: aspartate aminotransferase family protein [Armatimonadota bacterium]|nr:aspartate aminotransferase family protein [Armatimonadota bacterium]MDR7489234.1 aspartate aminotransferase family protein [Armatimonadota bacterium]MDR7492085.1 aspartate aminotransferase family protein [Armatimonadota bacterium]MDR7528840.1 aspartate aminotransferase family protein [Armatimonadota bacterium]MDR7586301.1 aspartate aminotransferase family protein [Armatimonadota bacterium]